MPDGAPLEGKVGGVFEAGGKGDLLGAMTGDLSTLACIGTNFMDPDGGSVDAALGRIFSTSSSYIKQIYEHLFKHPPVDKLLAIFGNSIFSSITSNNIPSVFSQKGGQARGG